MQLAVVVDFWPTFISLPASQSSRRVTRDAVVGVLRKAKPVILTPNAVRDSLQRVTDARRLDEVREKYRLPNAFILSVGADTPRRNYGGLLNALAKQWRSGACPPLVLVAAAPWDRTRVRELAARSDLLSHVCFRSGVSDADLAALYSLASAYVCPSLHEGFGMPVLEALACGAMVACSDLAPLREVAGPYARYFDPLSPESIRGAVAACRSTPDDRAARGRYAMRFSWEESARTLHGLFTELVARTDCHAIHSE